MKKWFLLWFCIPNLFFFGKVFSETVTLSHENLSWVVEAARTWPEKVKGLQKRKSLPADSGMLFFYESPQILSFWMKDTWIPLSIAFLDEKGCIVQIENMTPRSLKPIRSKKECLYALEMNEGWFKKRGLEPGDDIRMAGSLKQDLP